MHDISDALSLFRTIYRKLFEFLFHKDPITIPIDPSQKLDSLDSNMFRDPSLLWSVFFMKDNASHIRL